MAEVILRFEGGPMDGLEEESRDAPYLIFRTPPAVTIMRVYATADPNEEPPDFGATYTLAGIDHAKGAAVYRISPPHV